MSGDFRDVGGRRGGVAIDPQGWGFESKFSLARGGCTKALVKPQFAQINSLGPLSLEGDGAPTRQDPDDYCSRSGVSFSYATAPPTPRY